MKELIQHLRAVLQTLGEEKRLKLEPKLMSLSEETCARLKDLFTLESNYKDPDPTIKAGAFSLFTSWSSLLASSLKNLTLHNAAEALQKIEPILNRSLRAIRENKEWQKVLQAYPLQLRKAIEHEILKAILQNILSPLIRDKTITQDLNRVILSVFATQKLPIQKRLKAIQDHLPPTTITPTVCYFKGKDPKTFFGHVAVGVLAKDLPHDLVVCEELPPQVEDKLPMRDYLKKLPVNPQHNAIVVAGQGYTLNTRKITPSMSIEKAREMILKEFEEQLQLQPQLQLNPTLIKQGEKLYLYSRHPQTNMWATTLLTDLSTDQQRKLTALISPYGAPQQYFDGSKDLADVLETIKKFHGPLSPKVYYLSKKDPEDPGELRELDGFPKEFATFHDAFPTFLPPDEEVSRYVQTLTPSDMETLCSLLPKALPTFAQYLTYTAPYDSRSFGVQSRDFFASTDPWEGKAHPAETHLQQKFELELQAYTKEQRLNKDYFLLTLPPCKREDYEKEKRLFESRDKRDYTLSSNNCVSAVSQFVQGTNKGLVADSKGHNDIRPAACASRICDLQLKYLEECRENTLRDLTLAATEKISRLLEYEIERLNIRIKQDKFNPRVFKTKIKSEKIIALKALLSQFKAVRPPLLDLERALEQTITDMASKYLGQKNETLVHLKEYRDCFKPEHESGIGVRTGPASSSSGLFSSPRSAIAHRPSPPKWVSLDGKPSSQYCYLNLDLLEAKKNLRTALATPPVTKKRFTASETPLLSKSQLRMSTHTLPDPIDPSSSLRFGLLEKCITPSQELHSEILAPATPLSTQQWLYMITRQMEESNNLLGKKGTSLTIRSLDLSELEAAGSSIKLQSFEIAYMQYCLAKELTCYVMDERKGENQEMALAPAKLEEYLEKLDEDHNSAALKTLIEEVPDLSAVATPESSRSLHPS